MTHSLNRAFIKAYAKERADRNKAVASSASSSAKSVPTATESWAEEVTANSIDPSPWIVRFDTATVDLPAPHFLKSRDSRTVEVVPTSEPKKQAQATAPRPSQSRLSNNEIQGKTETVSTLETRNVEASLSSEFYANLIGDSKYGESIRSVVKTSQPQGGNEDELRRMIAEQMLRAGGWADGQIEDTVLSGFQASTVIASRADQPESTYHEGLPAPMTESVVGQVHPDFDADRSGRGGEFRRLDRPVGGNAQSVESPRGVEEKSNPNANAFGFESVEDQSTPPGAGARQVEENLRQARQRIFNPVWEVDSLQWPDICVELLQSRAESMDKVAKNLFAACQNGLQVLAITSPDGGEGRTTVACCLAMLAGSRGMNVAIVDGDVENPTLIYQTNLEVDADWKQALVNSLPLEEVAVHSIDDQVTLLPLLSPVTPDEMSHADGRVADMLKELSESFDLVIVDSGHMNSARCLVSGLAQFGAISAAVAVVDYRHSTQQCIESCIYRIRQAGVTSIGIVENFAA